MTPRLLQLVNRPAPFVALALLAAMLVLGGFRVREVPGADAYFNRIKSVIEDLPYKVGPWLGRDVEPSAAAVRLLKPNKILQRRYIDQETGRDVQVLIVHCGDTRDMEGHYPPVCYPAHGWTKAGFVDTGVVIAGIVVPARKYTFTRVLDGIERRMTVINFFVLPRRDRQYFADKDALASASQSTAEAGLGAAQIQLVSIDRDLDPERDNELKMILASLEPVLHTVAGGVTDHEP